MNVSKERGFLVVLSGPSGSGKTLLTRLLVERRKDCVLSISATTREQRPRERHGVDYFFMSEEDFLRRQQAGEFVETAKVFDHYYGTPRQFLLENIAGGKNVVMDIDVQGAAALMKEKQFSDGIFIFIIPKSREVLRERLKKRGRDDAAEIERRVDFAVNEIKCAAQYRYLIVNDVLDNAYQELESILRAEYCRRHATEFQWNTFQTT